ncbi:hypothetical protein BD324DRAFT_626704 [Kockovaella imperatae]|uniref:T-cell immunomodulatory protein TIP C2 domain-containing protein n=1 Tax=Kockovaella imperatae TaxID=4999 RepID=A0A1Y1UF69_9TREE|nr:hypothetical protein BD324DRAFT_626704 [Kockovaella imperatae]ORX36662.1 hypothetical protein BD324DRAFT_626704 [Kockovaella imperatae]
MRPSPAALFVFLHIGPTLAFWPFGSGKRFTSEAFVNAGALGLDKVQGRVVAVGDWNGDQKLDLFTLSSDQSSVNVHIWDDDAFEYKLVRTLSTSRKIGNIVPNDFNRDGHLDLLVMYGEDEGGWWSSASEKIAMEVYLADGKGGFNTQPWTMPDSSGSQPMIFDADGSLRPSLLGRLSQSRGEVNPITAWLNSGTGMSLASVPFQQPELVCHLSNPHSSAFVDINGDCLADLVLDCIDARVDSRSIQIWLNRGSEGFQFAKSYNLPSGAGALSFADMNRDGTLDIIFPTCSRVSTSTGACHGAALNVLYNRQVPICSGSSSEFVGGQINGTLKCRGWGELCIADDNFEFSFTLGHDSFLSIPFSSIWPKDTPELLVNVAKSPSIPLPLRPGDFNLDGFPDLLLTVSNSSAVPHGGVLGGSSTGTQVKILQNVPCARGVAGCGKSNKGRGFAVGNGKGYGDLDHIWDAQGASWIDIDDDGTLDIMVQRSGDQDKTQVAFIQNNFYHDAFFLKAQVLNGACERECVPSAGGPKYSPLGVSYSGATYKFTVLDTLGHRVAQQAAQLPQTGYHALGTPYSFIGLGRTNNYVERLYVGTSLYPPYHTTYIESLVPNSQIIINPPSPPDEGANVSLPVKYRSSGWRSELYLSPGDWVPWVGAAVVGLVCTLGFVVIWLNEREKVSVIRQTTMLTHGQREDEIERRRALHAINFQAL